MAELRSSDLQHEDIKNKNWWSQQYGYDYQANAGIQSNIHNMVKAEVEVGIESMAGEKSLAPTPGNYTVNGVRFVLTSDDVQAYCARYPQVCRTGTERQNAIDTIKNGGTFAPADVEPPPAEETPAEESAPPEPTAEEPSDSDEGTTTPVLPIPSSSATHKVKTRGSRLAFRDAPSTTNVSESASQDTDKKGELISMLDNGTHFTVLDPGVGYRCEWHHVKYNNTEGYVYNKFVEALDNSFLAYECINSANPVFKKSVDWTTKEINKPYEDNENGKWCVAYETEHISTGGSELQSRMLDTRTPALKIILSELGKNNSDEYAQSIVAAPAAVRVEDYYVSDRPGENMRVLVTLPKKYVSNLEEKSGDLEQENAEIFSGDVYSEESNLRKGTTRQTILYLEPSASYKDRVRRVSEGMRGYASQIDNFEGEVKNLDFRKEADRFERFVGIFDSLLSTNGAATTGAHSIELGLDDAFNPTYAAENSRGYYRVMTSGWDSFKDSEPADSQRSTRYLFFLWDMEEAINNNMDWIEFVGRFTDYEIVEIYPSGSSENSPSDISGMGNETNPSSSGQSAADKLDKEISEPETSIDSTCYEKVSVKGLAGGELRRGVDMNKQSMKSAAKKLTEDFALGGADIRKQIGKEARATADFVGEPILSDVVNQVGKINELDDVFEVVMNKISLMDLVGGILACFQLDLEFDIDIPLPMRLDCLTLPTVPTIALPDDLPTMDIMADLSKAVFDGIIEALTSAFVTMIKDLVVSLLEMCKEEASDSAADINNGIEEAAENASMNPEEGAKKAAQDKKDILAAAGLLSDEFGSPLTAADMQDRFEDLGKLLTDVSLLIPPSELCRLLKGNSSPRTLSTVRSLINKKYPNFAPKLKTKTRIKDFMILVGRLVPSRFCDALASAPKTRYGRDTRCDEVNGLGTPIAERMRAKGDGITEDQILEQLERAEQRKQKRSDAIKDMFEKLVDMQSGNSNPFQEAMPPLFCGKDASGAPMPGLIELEHDSLDYMMDMTMKTVFSPISMAFNRDINSFTPAIVSNTNEKVDTPAAIDVEDPASGDTQTILNPEVRRQQAMGIVFDFDVPEASDSDAHGKLKKEMITVEQGIRSVDASTRGLLRNLEGSGAFEVKSDEEGVYYELVLPPSPQMKDTLDKLADTLQYADKFMEANDPQLQSIKDLDINSLMQVAPDWKVRYKIPWQAIDNDNLQRYDDEYIVEIFPGESPKSELGLRRSVEVEMNPEVSGYVDELYQVGMMRIAAIAELVGGFNQLQNALTTSFIDNGDGTTTVNVHSTAEDDCLPKSQTLVDQYTLPNTDIFKQAAPKTIYDQAVEKIKNGEEVCRFLLAYIGDKEIWETVSELYESQGCWDYQNINNLNYKQLPPQQSVFGLHASKKLRERFLETTDVLHDDHKSYLESVRKYYSNYVHPQVTADVASMIAKQIANSVLFKSEEYNIGNVKSSTPHIEKLNFVREPTTLEKACSVSPHLLSVQDLIDSAKEEFKSGGGFCSMVDSITDAEKPDPLQEAMLKSVVQMTVRCYLIDYFLRGMFAFTEFSIESILDDYVLEFMVKKMMEEMRVYGDDYDVLFTEYLLSLETPPPADVSTDAEAPSVTTEENPEEALVTEPDLEKAAIESLKQIFIDEFAVVVYEMEQVFSKALKEDGFKFPTENEDLATKIIEQWIPVIDLPEDEDALRFSTQATKDITLTNEMNLSSASIDPESEPPQQTYLRERTSFGNGLDFDLNNGNLFLEKYLVIQQKFNATDVTNNIFNVGGNIDNEWKEFVKGFVNGFLQTRSTPMSTNEFQYYYEYNYDKIIADSSLKNKFRTAVEQKTGFNLEEFSELIDNAWTVAFGAEKKRCIGVAMFENKLEEFKAVLQSGVQEFKHMGIKIDHGSNLKVKMYSNEGYQDQYMTTNVAGIGQVQNSSFTFYYENGTNIVEDIELNISTTVTEDDGLVLSSYFDYVRPGLRLSYVPPIDTSAVSNTSFSNFFAGDSNARLEDPEGQALASMEKLSSVYGAYKVSEEFSRGSDIELVGDQYQITNNSTDTRRREVYVLPLVEVEDDVFWDNIKGKDIDEVRSPVVANYQPREFESIGVDGMKFPIAPSLIDLEYDSALNDLKEKMKESVEYKTLFRYSIPTERFLSLLTVYTMMSVSSNPAVETVFDGSKVELKRAFMNLLNADYKFVGVPSNDEASRVNEHFAGMTTPCFSFSFGGIGKLKGLGFDLVIKLAIKTPPMIFKGVVEFIDPNIKVAKWIIDLAKFIGVCLPMPAISLGLLPPTVFGPFGIGPPLTPLGFAYLAMGFEIPFGNPFADDDDESEDSSLEECQEKEESRDSRIDAIRARITNGQ